MRIIQNQGGHFAEDFQLLRRFVQDGSQGAFDQLVKRRLDFVYSVCRREVGDAGLAEDVTQAVFLILAQKAPCIRDEGMMAGWLFKTARFASRNALRRESRYQAGEREVIAEMMHQAAQVQSQDDVWGEIEPLLHSGIAALSRKDRELILLRYFENRSFKEVSGLSGMTEGAARKRVERALEKLKIYLRKHGVAVPVAALAASLAERAVAAAPATCAAATAEIVAGVTAAGVAAGGVGLTTSAVFKQSHAHEISQGVQKAMFINQLRVASIVVGISLAGVGATMATQSRDDDVASQARSNRRVATPGASRAETNRAGRGLAPRTVREVSTNTQAASGLAETTESAPAVPQVTAEALLDEVMKNYETLDTFSMQIDHDLTRRPEAGTGKYSQSLQWRKGSRFELLVTSNEDNVDMPNIYVDGTTIYSFWPNGVTQKQRVEKKVGVPVWAQTGGSILMTLEGTYTLTKEAILAFAKAKGVNLDNFKPKYGTRTEWRGQPVIEVLVPTIATPPQTKPSKYSSYFVSTDKKQLLGWESTRDGKTEWEAYTKQIFNPALPASLGTKP